MTRDAFIRPLFTTAAVVLALAALAGTAYAEKAHGGNNGPAVTSELYIKNPDGTYRLATDEEKSPQSHGSEKLSFIDIKRYDLGIYTLLVFGLLYLFIQFKVWPHIAEGLKKREAGILGARDEAQKARQDAEELRTRLQKEFADSQDKVRAMFEEARKEADKLKAAEKDIGVKDAQAERVRARKEIEAEREAIQQELYQQTVDLASILSAKTIRRALSPDDHRRLLDESLAELKSGAVKA